MFSAFPFPVLPQRMQRNAKRRPSITTTTTPLRPQRHRRYPADFLAVTLAGNA